MPNLAQVLNASGEIGSFDENTRGGTAAVVVIIFHGLDGPAFSSSTYDSTPSGDVLPTTPIVTHATIEISIFVSNVF